MGLKNCAVASTICIIVTVCSYSDNICASKKYALITSPVADLYHSPDIPSTLPIPAMTNTPCARINQALFNEVFEITKTNGNMIALSIPWAIYGYDKDNKPLNTYWIRSENFVTLDAIPSKHRYALPFFDRKHDVITLIRPFTTPRGVTYSVGTEFVCSAKQDSPHTYQVYYLDIPAGIIRTLSIPRTKAIAHKKRSQAQARKVCVKLLREFVADIAQQKSYNTIPYVWGGNSFVKAYTTHFTQNVGGFSRTEHETVPLSGYDCSSLILRFSRIAGVPYYFKTTALLEKHGSALSSTDTLQEGISSGCRDTLS